MPAPATCDEFLDIVLESGLVEPARLQEFLEQFYAVSSMPENPADLAGDLLKAGILTGFQKDQLVQGKRRGFVIADKYVLLDHLGAGGMGSVFLCEHKVMRRRVAIKVLPAAFAKDPEYLQRFHREARAAAALDHRNIVRAYDVDQDGKMHFLVMEYVEGSSLHALVSKEGPLDIQRAADYMAQAAAGLEHAHEAGLVHRDIKPGNLLVDRKGTLKILDMGLALFFQEKGVSLTTQYDASAILGTADYLAPEQVVDSHNVDIRADIYSLGLTFFFLLTGRSPYGDEGTIAQKLLWHQMRPAKSVREFRPDVSEGLAAIITKMLAKDREERYQKPQEVVDALAPWVHGTALDEPQPEAPVVEPESASSATAATTMAGSTLKGSAAPSETDVNLDRKGPPALPDERGPKTGRNSKTGPASKRPGKSGKLSGERTLKKGSGKEPKSSGKHRRVKAPDAGFWTRQRIIIAAASGALVLVLCIGGVIWAIAHSRGSKTSPPSTSGSSEIAQAVNTTKATAVTPVPAQPSSLSPSNKAALGQDSNPPSTRTTGPPVVPPEAPTKMVEPTKTETHGGAISVQTPTTPMDTKPPPEIKKPEVKKTESLADYVPKPGSTLFYDMGTYAQGAAVVYRQRWEVKEKGEIEVTYLRVGLVEGARPLLAGGIPRWSPRPYQGKEKQSYRIVNGHVEMGPFVKLTNSVVWEPILPVSAAEGDTWKWQMPSGDIKKYTIVNFVQYKGHPAVLTRDTSTLPDAEIVTMHTYAKEIGEVSRSVSLEKKGAPSKLLAELKLVDQ